MTDRHHFRIWDKVNNKMHKPKGSHGHQIYCNQEGQIFWWSHKGFEYHKDAFIKLDSTGLKDKNGKLIFDGDIVELDQWKPKYHQIEFIEGGFCCTHPNLKGYPTDINMHYPSGGCQITVVGNIYEDSHLLKEQG